MKKSRSHQRMLVAIFATLITAGVGMLAGMPIFDVPAPASSGIDPKTMAASASPPVIDPVTAVGPKEPACEIVARTTNRKDCDGSEPRTSNALVFTKGDSSEVRGEVIAAIDAILRKATNAGDLAIQAIDNCVGEPTELERAAGVRSVYGCDAMRLSNYVDEIDQAFRATLSHEIPTIDLLRAYISWIFASNSTLSDVRHLQFLERREARKNAYMRALALVREHGSLPGAGEFEARLKSGFDHLNEWAID